MIRSTHWIYVALQVAVAGLPMTAAQAGQFTSIYAFGDSLSDAGNVYLATGGTEPAAPYFAGHFSNGPTWVEDLAGSLGVGALTPSLRGGNDYAYGGAVTGNAVPLLPGESVLVPTISQQAAQYIAASGGLGHASATALYTVWVGSNDVIQAVDDVYTTSISTTTAVIDLAAAASAEAAAVDVLAKDGAKTFLVPLVPALGLTPELNTTPLAGLGNAFAAQYNADLSTDLAAVAAADVITIDTINIFSLIENIVTDPTADGYSNVTAACYVGLYTGGGTTCGTPDQYLFWDGLHPTETGQLLIASAALTAVPEPGSLTILFAAILGLALLQLSTPLRARVRRRAC